MRATVGTLPCTRLPRRAGEGERKDVRIDQGQVMSGDAVGITLGHLISMPCHEESMETEFIPFESVPSEMACICFEFVDSLID